MTLSKADIVELKELQPELVIIGDKISGCFFLSASFRNKTNKLNYHTWNSESTNLKHICDIFYIDINLDENLYPVKVFSKGILFSDNKTPEEYWHVNPDNSLCLGEEPDILEMQKQYPFAQFINILLMQYFYYMNYAKRYKREPWEAYRHGLFAMLEMAYNNKNIKDNLESLNSHKKYCEKEWLNLLNKTKRIKIKNTDQCPFCKNSKLSKNCQIHRKHIKGHNNLMPFTPITP